MALGWLGSVELAGDGGFQHGNGWKVQGAWEWDSLDGTFQELNGGFYETITQKWGSSHYFDDRRVEFLDIDLFGGSSQSV